MPWTDGAEAARLTIWSATEQGSLCSLKTATGHGFSKERDFDLGPGTIELEWELAEIRGPLSAAFGTRRYRTVAVVAGGVRFVLPEDRGPLIGSGDGGILARLLGVSTRRLNPTMLAPATLATAAYILQPDGSISLVLD
ncbi:MAG: hypothetical protein A2Y38_05875 [Spirochaetes bacterium GWB1_59_5]|nr:MAG: hypothetical protein A2Y38_05875 [Spirochaetes bacterium GWB1_59_5]